MTLPAPLCPACGHPPAMLLSAEQVFCGNERCNVFCWDMTRDPAEQLAAANEVNTTDWPEELR